MTHASIRLMTEADLEPVVAFITDFPTLDGELSRTYYERYFRAPASDREQNFVACVGDTLVGVTGFYPDKYDRRDLLWINWLFVDAAHRGQGIGRALLDFTLERARSMNCRKIYLDTTSDAVAAATRLYTMNGFVQEGELTDYYEEGEHFLIYGCVL